MGESDGGDPMVEVAESIRTIARSLRIDATGPEMERLIGLNAATVTGVLAGNRALGEVRRRHIVVTARLLGRVAYGEGGPGGWDQGGMP